MFCKRLCDVVNKMEDEDGTGNTTNVLAGNIIPEIVTEPEVDTMLQQKDPDLQATAQQTPDKKSKR